MRKLLDILKPKSLILGMTDAIFGFVLQLHLEVGTTRFTDQSQVKKKRKSGMLSRMVRCAKQSIESTIYSP